MFRHDGHHQLLDKNPNCNPVFSNCDGVAISACHDLNDRGYVTHYDQLRWVKPCIYHGQIDWIVTVIWQFVCRETTSSTSNPIRYHRTLNRKSKPQTSKTQWPGPLLGPGVKTRGQGDDRNLVFNVAIHNISCRFPNEIHGPFMESKHTAIGFKIGEQMRQTHPSTPAGIFRMM